MESSHIQAFILPEDPHPNSNKTGVLRLSHESISSDDVANLTLIRNSTINSITKSSSLRFLRLQTKGEGLSFSCVDLTLSRSHSEIVLPLSIEMNDIFAVESGIYDHVMAPTGYYIEASNDGYARGFFRNRIEKDDWNPWINKFTVDASGDKCVADVGKAMLPRWLPNQAPPRFSLREFDGIAGRCFYIRNGHNWRSEGRADIEVVDIK